MLTSLPLLRKVVEDLEEARNTGSLYYFSALAGMMFGAIHCAGWVDGTFPSNAERGIWRVASLILVGTCIIGSLAATSYWGPVGGHGLVSHDLQMVRFPSYQDRASR